MTKPPPEEFLATVGWLNRFMKRHGLSLRRATNVAQKDPENLIGKLVSFVLRVKRLREKHQYQTCDIIAMDETPGV